ncbi:MAG TPA: TetR family transcriptional regulator [Myxococcota bacterium]|nr:TetR family transcriptional regulator [Myxococcota bacterium]HRY95552.1 TetR family transcriptional regulator [Myxococcota bacterium]HSA21695.1 TetR family transcriptional regulator [Myxococcota bacterium]
METTRTHINRPEDQPPGLLEPAAGESATKGARTQRAILEAAKGLFIAQGYHGTSIREVATGAGVTIGAVYNYFDSKEAIFEQVFADYNPFRFVPETFQSARGETPEELLRDIARRLEGMLHQRSDLLRLVFIELLEFNGRHLLTVLTRNAALVDEFRERLGQAGGARLRDMPPFLLLRTFLGLLSAWFLAETLFQDKLPPSLAALRMEDAVDVFLHGALAEAPTNAPGAHGAAGEE